ncbi:MAG: ATP-binding protein, partial [Deltaproteobacteria bacterium]|nr:ATP-binding protein [Deltaproteobacteria bacterium]
DEMRIGEIITNLVSNAAAYSDEGTRITLEAEAVDGHITLSVSDEGIGIPPEYIEKVFDQFFRLESGVARRKGGTGLGLSICKGIVKAHSGEIWVESEPGKGSVFRFKLPVMNGHGS